MNWQSESSNNSPEAAASSREQEKGFFDAPRPPRRRRREVPTPGSELCVSNPAIQEVLDVETGEHVLVQAVIGTDFAELMKLRMRVRTQMRKEEPLYRCAICATPVHLCSRMETKRFYFKHRHEDGNCPAITRGTLSQEEIDARKYNGAKESRLHLKMKEWLAKCLQVDGRFEGVKTEARWSGPLTGEWRKPDVRATYDGLPIAFEIQLSTTHLDVIAARREFYLQHGGLLFWIFATFDSEHGRLTEEDVFYNNNQNIFVVNANTVAESLSAEEFRLECVWSQPAPSGSVSALHRETVSFHDLTLDQEKQQGYYFDFEGQNEQFLLQWEAGNLELRNELEGWFGAKTKSPETFLLDWRKFLYRLRKSGVALPSETGYFYYASVISALYSAKHGKPWGQGLKKLVEVAHSIANKKHFLTWFMHAVRKYGREAALKAEGDPRKWAAKYQACKEEYRRQPELFAPPEDLKPLVEFLFPELCPFPTPLQSK